MVGLGNPGAEYEETRHNIGFKVVDSLAQRLSGSFETGRLGEVSTVRFKGRQIVLLKPSTFMNLCGKAVRYWICLLYTSPSPRDKRQSRMPSSA